MYEKAIDLSMTIQRPHSALACEPCRQYAMFMYEHHQGNSEVVDGIEQLLADAFTRVGGSFMPLPEAGLSREDLVNYAVLCGIALLILKQREGRHSNVRGISENTIRLAVQVMEKSKAAEGVPEAIAWVSKYMMSKIRNIDNYGIHENDLVKIRNQFYDLVQKYPVLKSSIEDIEYYLDNR